MSSIVCTRYDAETASRFRHRRGRTTEALIAAFLLVLPVWIVVLLSGGTAGAATLVNGPDGWAGLTGYGQSFPGWGQTNQRVETVDLVPRYSRVLLADLGSGWYRGEHSIFVELPLHIVLSPETSAMVGMNFLACYTFTADERMRPYLFGGGGPVYSFADIPGMGAELNGNYQFGIGLEYPLEEGRRSLLMELRYHHISNAGAAEPNDPLNSLKVLVGITL